MFGAAASTGGDLPFWLANNRYGTVDRTSANLGLRLGARRPFSSAEGLEYAIGAELLARASRRATLTAHELYGRLRYWKIQLTAGRREQSIGRVDTSLSLGSVTRSPNAPPVPRVSISSNGYVPIPGTAGGVALKGYLAHGWLESDRFVRNTLLHEKYLYARLLPSGFPINGYVGISHHAMWGGTSPQRGPQGVSLREWVDVAFGSDVLSDSRSETESRCSNANHLAMYDFSVSADLGGLQGLMYRQFYHEDIASLNFRNVWDGLWGVSLRRDSPALVDALLWEHLRMTRHNAKFDQGQERGADTYYNHYIYFGGWTYQGRTLGAPLLVPASATPGFASGLPGVGNNIVAAHHVGIEGHLGQSLSYQLMGTYSRNYGAKGVCQTPACEARGDERTPRHDQYSFRLEVGGPVLQRQNLRFNAAVAVDTGEFYEERFGGQLALLWRGFYRPEETSTSQ